MPALVSPPTVTAVSRAPHNWPFAYTTCCMRVSLLSRCDSTTPFFGWSLGKKKARQQPAPFHKSAPPKLGLFAFRSLRQSPSGMLPGFWLDLGGIEYGVTLSPGFVRCRAGVE